MRTGWVLISLFNMLGLMEDTHILNCDGKNRSLLFCYCDVSLSSSLSLLNQFSARHKDEQDGASLGISEFTAAPVGVPSRYSDAKKVCVCVWEGRHYVGKKMEENVVRESMNHHRDFPFTTTWFVLRLSPLYLCLSFSQPWLTFQDAKMENEMRKLFIRLLDLSQRLTNCSGQPHVPWVSGLKHFVTLKIFT